MPLSGSASAPVAGDRPSLERRAHARHSAADLPWLDGIRLKYAPPVSLIDLSRGGAQIDTADYRLRPGSRVLVEIAGREGQVIVGSLVVRCEVAALAPQTIYRGAVAFERPLDLDAVSLDAGSAARQAMRVGEYGRPESGWSRVVVRYADNRTLRGFTRDFLPGGAAVDVWPRPDAAPHHCISVRAHHLKMIFFVGEDSPMPMAAATAPAAAGQSRLAVTFLDNEVLVGTALDYQPDAVGFFMTRLEARDPADCAFVFSRSIRHVGLPLEAKAY
jgi:hypothetical protein